VPLSLLQLLLTLLQLLLTLLQLLLTLLQLLLTLLQLLLTLLQLLLTLLQLRRTYTCTSYSSPIRTSSSDRPPQSRSRPGFSMVAVLPESHRSSWSSALRAIAHGC
jgi:hypothetical protein